MQKTDKLRTKTRGVDVCVCVCVSMHKCLLVQIFKKHMVLFFLDKASLINLLMGDSGGVGKCLHAQKNGR